jgi:hypothetical protein
VFNIRCFELTDQLIKLLARSQLSTLQFTGSDVVAFAYVAFVEIGVLDVYKEWEVAAACILVERTVQTVAIVSLLLK